MTSSQPVVTQNAINFTPDNKRCYAYSGEVSVANVELFLLDFQTNSEYIHGEVMLGSKAGENEDFEFKIYFNDVIVFSTLFGNQGHVNTGSWPIPIIIPPFTAVKMSLDNLVDTDLRVWTVGLTGEAVGMIKTEYQ